MDVQSQIKDIKDTLILQGGLMAEEVSEIKDRYNKVNGKLDKIQDNHDETIRLLTESKIERRLFNEKLDKVIVTQEKHKELVQNGWGVVKFGSFLLFLGGAYEIFKKIFS